MFTTPLSLATLHEHNRECPICLELYVEPPPAGHTHSIDQEWPVRVDMIAERSGFRRLCGHIFGRACLEKWFRTSGLWRNSCPLCRDTWFDLIPTNRLVPNAESQTDPERYGRQPLLRRSSRIAARRSLQQPLLGTHRNQDRVGGQRVARSSSIASRSPNFMQQLLGLLEVESGSDVVKATLEQVERRLGTLYEGA